MTKRRLLRAMALATALAAGPRLAAQVQAEVPPVVPGAQPVTVEHIKIHGTALEENLEGNVVDPDAIVFLPPSNAKEPARRYPVVYALHGYSIGAEQWTHEIHVPQTIEGALAQGAQEMIVVLPDSKTVHNGSMYSSSVTTGDFERFVAHDVVAYTDAHYRTIPDRKSRGLVGHSMGGYGATRIGMKHAAVFGSLYIMSPCCLSPRPAGPRNPELAKALEDVKTPADSAKLSFFPRAQLATAAAWLPNPRNPPLYLDLPTKDGVPRPEVLARWTADAPLAFLDQHIGVLRRYRAIAIDVGDQDGLRSDAGKLHDVLDAYPTSARLPRWSRAFRRYEPEADDDDMHEGARVGPGSEIPMRDCGMTRGVAPARRGGLPSGSAKLSYSYPVLTRPEGSDPCRGES
jgi:enterochelin esterase-like enzyme